MKPSLLKRFLEVRAAIKAMEDEEEAIRAEIAEDMKAIETDRMDTQYGQFLLVPRRTWVYSDKVKKAKEKVKVLERKEQDDGIATFKETVSLTFNEKNLQKPEGDH